MLTGQNPSKPSGAAPGGKCLPSDNVAPAAGCSAADAGDDGNGGTASARMVNAAAALPEISWGDCPAADGAGGAGHAGNGCCAAGAGDGEATGAATGGAGAGGAVAGGASAYRLSIWLGAGGAANAVVGGVVVDVVGTTGGVAACGPPSGVIEALPGEVAGFRGAAKLLFTTPADRNGSPVAPLAGGATAVCGFANESPACVTPLPMGKFAYAALMFDGVGAAAAANANPCPGALM
jgi:hypothetical protein